MYDIDNAGDNKCEIDNTDQALNLVLFLENQFFLDFMHEKTRSF